MCEGFDVHIYRFLGDVGYTYWLKNEKPYEFILTVSSEDHVLCDEIIILDTKPILTLRFLDFLSF